MKKKTGILFLIFTLIASGCSNNNDPEEIRDYARPSYPLSEVSEDTVFINRAVYGEYSTPYIEHKVAVVTGESTWKQFYINIASDSSIDDIKYLKEHEYSNMESVNEVDYTFVFLGDTPYFYVKEIVESENQIQDGMINEYTKLYFFDRTGEIRTIHIAGLVFAHENNLKMVPNATALDVHEVFSQTFDDVKEIKTDPNDNKFLFVPEEVINEYLINRIETFIELYNQSSEDFADKVASPNIAPVNDIYERFTWFPHNAINYNDYRDRILKDVLK